VSPVVEVGMRDKHSPHSVTADHRWGRAIVGFVAPTRTIQNLGRLFLRLPWHSRTGQFCATLQKLKTDPNHA